LQITLTAQVAKIDHQEMIKQHMPQIRSRLLFLLSSKKASEIATLSGKQTLTTEILAAIREPYAKNDPPQPIIQVLFTSFVIQ
jgi:flagellar FliL protein